MVATRPSVHLLARHRALRRVLREHGLDALLLTHPADLAWATDFTGEDSLGIVTPRTMVLVTDSRFEEQAQRECPWLRVVLREGKMADVLGRTLLKMGVGRIGFEAATTSFGLVMGLRAALAGHGVARAARSRPATSRRPLRFVPMENVLVGLRKVKDDVELAVLRRAVKVAEDAFLTLRPRLKPGMTENEVAATLTWEMRRRGASDASFPVIVAAGANSSLPHYRPRQVKLPRRGVLLVDWGARLDGYCSDLTRTLFIGRPAGELKRVYGVVLEAQLAAIAAIRPGVNTCDVDKAARDHIAQAGYGPRFGHGLGHGIGRDIHEAPGLRKTPPGEPLRPGMVVTVEPGVYLPGVGGVRIEDDVLVTDTGCEVLSSLGKTLDDNIIPG